MPNFNRGPRITTSAAARLSQSPKVIGSVRHDRHHPPLQAACDQFNTTPLDQHCAPKRNTLFRHPYPSPSRPPQSWMNRSIPLPMIRTGLFALQDSRQASLLFQNIYQATCENTSLPKNT